MRVNSNDADRAGTSGGSMTGVRFEFAGASLAEMQVGGYINAADVDAFADLVTHNLGLVVERTERRWIVGAQP